MENKLLQGMLDWHERMLKEKRFNIPLDHEQSEYLLWLASDIKNNPSQYIDCVSDEEIEAMADEAGYPRSDKSTFETTYWTQHNIWVEGYKASHTAPVWVDVKDSPLITKDERDNWTCTEAGDKEFIAAVPYNDSKRPGKELWWIRHCVIEDGIGLCVVGDNDNTPAGWEIEDITHYQRLPQPPEIK